MKREQYVKEIEAILKELGGSISDLRRHPLQDFQKGSFIPILKSSYAKTYDFCIAVTKSSKNESFIYMPFLRGICEDIISLKYLSKRIKNKDDRNRITSLYAWYLQFSNLKAQQNFFAIVKTDQPALEMDDPETLVVRIEESLKQFWTKEGQNPNKIFPGVQHMAIDAKLKDLYEFLYHATSNMVHFSPNILMRLGWYLERDDNPMIEFKISNFNKYYYSFNNYYAPYLFVLFSKQFKSELALNSEYLGKIKQIEQILLNLEFYPELVTFEEMNEKRPNSLMDSLIRTTRKAERQKLSSRKRDAKH